MILKFLFLLLNCWSISGLTTDRSHLTPLERSIDVSICELDKRIVHFLSEPPPDIDKNVQANANMNVLLFRSLMDYFNYLNGIGDLLLDEDNTAYRLLKEIGVEGPEFLKLEMNKMSWNAIAKMYDFHEGEIDEMVSTLGSIKVMWDNMKKVLELHLENKQKDKTKNVKRKT